MYPHPYVDIEERDKQTEPTIEGDRVEINVYRNDSPPTTPQRKPKSSACDRPSSRMQRLAIAGCGALALICVVWHFAGVRYRQEATRKEQEHQAKIEQLERRYESERARLRAVEGVVCHPAP